MDPELRRLLDRQEIQDLIHAYCECVDTYQPAKVAALFTADCITDYGPSFGGESVGPELVEKGCAYTLATFEATSHHVTNIRLHFEGDDTARGVTYLYAWHKLGDGKPDFQIWARYLDRFTRTPEGWRFSERRLAVAGQAGAQNDFPGIGRRSPDPALLEKIRKRRESG